MQQVGIQWLRCVVIFHFGISAVFCDLRVVLEYRIKTGRILVYTAVCKRTAQSGVTLARYRGARAAARRGASVSYAYYI